MGNAPSATDRSRGRQPQKWGWEYRNGRYQPKPVGAAAAPARLKWAKQRSDNYDWWIFNPDRNNSSSNDEWPAMFLGKKKRQGRVGR